jgi:hypothetical protein
LWPILGDESFENEGVVFSEVLIDNIPHEMLLHASQQQGY